MKIKSSIMLSSILISCLSAAQINENLKKLPIENGKYSKNKTTSTKPPILPNKRNGEIPIPIRNNVGVSQFPDGPKYLPEKINSRSNSDNELALKLIKKLQLDPEEVSKKKDVIEKKRLSKVYEFLLPDPVKMIKIGNKIHLYCMYSAITLDWSEIKKIMEKESDDNLQKFFKLKKEKMIKLSKGDEFGNWIVTEITNHSITYSNEELFKKIKKYY